MSRDIELLHEGGRAGAWGNLGLWAAATPDYAGAARALATAVAHAAGLQRGDRVLAVACGAGEELRLWLQDFGAAEVVGVETDAGAIRQARQIAPAARVLQGSGQALLDLGLPEAHFDRVLCVDAAYHLRPRQRFLAAARRLLRPGGTLAYTDLVAEQPHPLLQGAARLCGLHADTLCPLDTQVRRLGALGFTDIHTVRLDDAVLGGFARFLRSRRLPPWRWPRVATTAALIGPCRAAGLGYAMLSATASAERTALSSSGTPGIA